MEQPLSQTALLRYSKHWIALSYDRSRILAIGTTRIELVEKLRREHIEGVILHYVPDPTTSLSLPCQS